MKGVETHRWTAVIEIEDTNNPVPLNEEQIRIVIESLMRPRFGLKLRVVNLSETVTAKPQK